MTPAVESLRGAVEYGLITGKRNVIADLAPLDDLFRTHDALVAALQLVTDTLRRVCGGEELGMGEAADLWNAVRPALKLAGAGQ